MFEVRALGSVKVSGDEVVKLHSIVQALTPHPSYTYIGSRRCVQGYAELTQTGWRFRAS